jgi:hypothetical protein
VHRPAAGHWAAGAGEALLDGVGERAGPEAEFHDRQDTGAGADAVLLLVEDTAAR